MDNDQIISEMMTVLSTERFSASPKLSKFLEYVVRETVEGRQGDLKGYSIGVDVLDRPTDFDPSTDNTVRVMASRLRKALKTYYLTDGASNEIHITLPKGGYVPEFTYHPRSGLGSPGAASKPVASRKWRSRMINALVAIGAIVAVAILVSPSSQSEAAFERAAEIASGPSVAVLPFETVGSLSQSDDAVDVAALTTGLYFEIVGKLSRFKDIVIVNARQPGTEAGFQATDPIEIQYFLTGSVRADGPDIRITSVLTRATTGAVVWTGTHMAALDGASTLIELEGTVASEVASALGRPSSDMNTQFESEAVNLENVEAEHYLCLMNFYEYTQGKSEANHGRVRDCLETALGQRPNFSSGWAALSWMYGDEARNDYNVSLSDKPPFERALEAASEAVKADSSNAMAYQYLAVAHFELGNIDGFRRAGGTALELNPNDPEVLADVGSHLIQIGEPDTGLPLVEKAIRLNPAHPPWYHGSIIRYFYETGDSEQALVHAREYLKDDSVVAHAMFVACLERVGRSEDAAKAYGLMVNKFPRFARDYEAIMATWQLSDRLYVMINEDLMGAGLSGQPS